MFVVDFRDNIRMTIPVIAKHMEDSDPGVRMAAIELLSRLAALGMC